MTFLQLIRLIVLKNIRADRFLTVLSIIGVALGIGLFSGVKVASDRAAASFESDIRGINPYVKFEILDTSGVDFHEQIYKKVRELNDESFPVLDIKGYLSDIRQTVDISGIDIIRAIRFLKLPSVKHLDFADYFRVRNGVIITKLFAHSHSLKKGDSLKALVYDREFTLRIVDIVDTPLLPSNSFFMDIGNFQEHFGKSGYLSKIDVAADDKTVEEIRRILPPSLSIDKKEQLIADQKSLIKSFGYNLQFISLIAILVGIFLLYNTIFISSVKRRPEIGILRGLGIGKKTVMMLFIIHGLILGLTGSVLGVLFGQVVVYFSVAVVERTISTMYSTISITDYFMTVRDILLSLSIGLIVSLLASAVPAFEAAGTRPNESVKEGSFESKHRVRSSYYFFAGILLVISGSVLSYIEYRSMPFEFPFLAYTGILLIILGVTVLSPSYLAFLLKVFKKPLGNAFRSTGVIAAGDMEGNIYRFSVALMSVAISTALIISLFTLIFSFRISLMTWIEKNISADVYIKPVSCTSNFCYFPLSEGLVRVVERFPGVAFVDKFRTLQIDYGGKKIVAGFGERESNRNPAHQESAVNKNAEGERLVGVSSYLGARYGLKAGDKIELATPAGKVEFIISEVFSSYSTASGFVYLDRRWLREYWGLDDATQLGIYLGKGADVQQFIGRLGGAVLPHYSVEIMNNGELRARVLSIFDRTFAITYAIELISIVVSLIGVINTLLTLVLERKMEISILRYLGAGWSQLRGILVLSAGIVGIAGIFLGSIIGPAMSIIFIEVINKISFGWEIHYHLPFFYIFITALGLFLTTLIAGMIPLRVAKKIDPKRFISFE